MSNINQGSQTITFDFKLPAKGSTFAKLNRNVIRPGIYSGLNISYVGNNVFISTGTSVLNCQFSNNDNLQVKVDFDSIYNYGITNPTTISENEVLYLEYEYGEVTENYVDFKHTSFGSFDFNNKNLIVIGELVYNISNNIISVYYGNRTYGLTYSDLNYAIPDNTKYYNTIDNTKLFYIDGSLLPNGTRKINIPNFTQNDADLLLTNTSNTTIIKNNLLVSGTTLSNNSDIINNLNVTGISNLNTINIINTLNVTGDTNLRNTNVSQTLNVTGTTTLTNVTISDRLTTDKFYGRVPIGGVIPVIGVFQSTSNGGTFTSASLPSSGSITNDGFQRCDGAIINNALSIFNGKYTPNISDNRFIQGSTTAGTISSDTGVNNGDNTITLTKNEMPTHSHTIDHGHSISDPGHAHTMYTGVRGISNFIPEDVRFPYAPNFRPGENSNEPWVNGSTTGISVVSHSGNSGNSGSGSSFDIRPKYINAVYLIRVI